MHVFFVFLFDGYLLKQVTAAATATVYCCRCRRRCRGGDGVKGENKKYFWEEDG